MTITTNLYDPAWMAQTTEEQEEIDEPPELSFCQSSATQNFQRTPVRRPNEQSSLLTKAIMGQSDEDVCEVTRPIDTHSTYPRRRSLTSNVSVASTADLTSDTGLTSPSRPNTPSPPVPEMAMLQLNGEMQSHKNVSLIDVAVRHQEQSGLPKEAPRKRCIQFACAKPNPQEQPPRAHPMVRTPSAQEAPRKSCIKFACPSRPASTQNTPPQYSTAPSAQPMEDVKAESPSTPKRSSVLSMAVPISPRQSTPRRLSTRSITNRTKFLQADSQDLVADASQFHEFASAVPREDDWIRQDDSNVKTKLTINDTLTKENHIRKLATEAEEEAELEDEDEEAAIDEEEDGDDLDEDVDDDDDDDDDNDDEDEDEDDDDDEDEDNDSDGYHTDEETGFADSEEEVSEGDDLTTLWTPNQRTANHFRSIRRPSVLEQQSDSSTGSRSSVRRVRAQRIKPRSDTPDLPDSTDFVCGTLDEDRPLEEAYLSCLAARRNEKLRVIPQDIDPSFPASDPEDEEEEEIYNPVHRDSDEEFWPHGGMEDLHHENDRSRRRRKSELQSPRKFRSPPPKRHVSPPPPKRRGRSPKPLFDRQSPRRLRSPAPKVMTTPNGSPRLGQVNFNLAGRPGLTHTKSLPRAGAVFGQLKMVRNHKVLYEDDIHVRGAVDIVKGLERKRQRRKEKFHQKYCNRARRGQIPERKPQPGRGAERMKELGLLMAGKKDQGNYVLSI